MHTLQSAPQIASASLKKPISGVPTQAAVTSGAGLASLAASLVCTVAGEASRAESGGALAVVPSYTVGGVVLGPAVRAGGRAREAVEALVDLLAGDPYHFDALLLLGQVLLDDGRRGDARTAFARILRFDPNRADASFHLGVVAAAERRFREAIEHWRQAVEADPEGPYAAPARDNIHTALDIASVFQTAAAPAGL